MRFSIAALAVVALAQLASATFITPKPQTCKKNEFWYAEKSMCLPTGGPAKPPPPPTGVQCPPSWSWGAGPKCCLPHQPKPPAPTCPKGWTWWPLLWKCLPTPKPPVPHPPVPSKPPTPHVPKPPHYPEPPKPPHHGGHGKRGDPSRIALCPSGLRACPLPGLISGDYECVDTTADLTSCGGCVSEGKGQDCTAIKGAWNVACESGACVVHSCTAGYEMSFDRKTCVRL